jgi:myo-inositol 2-dehydrogenase / D-chiro-inositol 1-dehydrogenase
VVFIGAGAVARRHATVLGGFDDVELVGHTDLDRDAAAAMTALTAAPAFDGIEAMLDAVAPDAVYVCVPPFAHGEPERAVIARGAALFVEKPLAVGVEVAEELAAAVAERGLVTGTGYHWRHLDGTRRARELLVQAPARLLVGAWLDKVPPPAWWVRRDRSGGQVVEQATHLLDCMLDLAGPVDHVYALGRRDAPAPGEGDVDTSAAAVLRFAGGAVGSLTATSLLRAKARASLELVCDGRRLELSETRLTVDEGAGPVHFDHDPAEAKRLVDRTFIDAVQGRPGGLLAPYDVAVRTHRVGCAIAASTLTGAPVDPAAGP